MSRFFCVLVNKRKKTNAESMISVVATFFAAIAMMFASLKRREDGYSLAF